MLSALVHLGVGAAAGLVSTPFARPAPAAIQVAPAKGGDEEAGIAKARSAQAREGRASETQTGGATEAPEGPTPEGEAGGPR